MNQSQAIAKLKAALGRGFAYRLDPKAPKPAQRQDAADKLRAALLCKKSAADAAKARYEELLKDPKYVKLRAEADALSKECDKLAATTRHYPITVGVNNGMWFSIKAEGDNWQEVVDKVTKGA